MLSFENMNPIATCILYLVGIGEDMILSIILIRFIGLIGYNIPSIIQIWGYKLTAILNQYLPKYHLVYLQGNKRELWISYYILPFEENPLYGISWDTSIEEIQVGSKFLVHLVSCYRRIWNHAVIFTLQYPSFIEEIGEIMWIKETVYV